MGVELDFTTKADNLIAKIFYNGFKLICTDMRSCRIKNFFRCTKFCKTQKYLSASAVFYTCCKLTIRKCSCTARAELNNGVGVEIALCPEAGNLIGAFFNRRATL